MSVFATFSAWLSQFGVTQAFGQNGEQGTDYGVPFHTPVPLALSGTVESASYGPWGGLVKVVTSLPGVGKITEQFVHIDQIAPGVVPGAQLPAGYILGLSGGENPGYPGALHPADPQFSTGPHIEFDLQGPGGNYVNPQTALPFAEALANRAQQNGRGAAPMTNTGGIGGLMPIPTGIVTGIINGISGLAGGVISPVQNAIDNTAGTAVQAVGNSFSDMFTAVKDYITGGVERFAFFLLAMSIFMVGVVLIVWEPAKEIVVDPVVGAAKAKGGALKSAAAASVGKAASAVIGA